MGTFSSRARGSEGRRGNTLASTSAVVEYGYYVSKAQEGDLHLSQSVANSHTCVDLRLSMPVASCKVGLWSPFLS